MSEGAFVMVPVRLSEDKRLRKYPLAERVYVLTLRHARTKQSRASYVSYEAVAKQIGCSTRTVARTVAVLVATGWLAVEARPGKTHLYLPGDGKTPDTGVSGPPDTGVTPPLTPVSDEVEEGADEELSRSMKIRSESSRQRAASRTLREETVDDLGFDLAAALLVRVTADARRDSWSYGALREAA